MNDDHLPAPGQLCEVCGEDGHLACIPAKSNLNAPHAIIAGQLAEIYGWPMHRVWGTAGLIWAALQESP